MKQIILKVLSEIACNNTGSCPINMQSESAREMIANKLVNTQLPKNDLESLFKYTQERELQQIKENKK